MAKTHLSEAAFAQHGQEVKVLDGVLAETRNRGRRRCYSP